MIEIIASQAIKEISKEAIKEIVKETIKEIDKETIKDFSESSINKIYETVRNQSLESLKAKNESILNDIATKRPLYNENPSKLKWIEKFDKVLGDVDGYLQTKMKTLSLNESSARGHFAELVRAYRAHRAGLEVKALNKSVETSLGRTDIDIWLKNSKGENIWIENKDSQNLLLNEKTKTQIDKMNEGLEKGVKIDGENVRFDKNLFINNQEIPSNLKEYSESKKIHCKEKMDGRVFEKYIKNLSNQ